MKLNLENEHATTALAQHLAPLLQAGDVVRLHGELGAGKSTCARALMRALGTQSQHLPSPTYTIAQFYDDTRLPIAHLDCYRLTQPEELDYLGLEDVFKNGVIIAEWPPESLTAHTGHTLDVTLAIQPNNTRTVVLSGAGRWVEILEQKATAWATL